MIEAFLLALLPAALAQAERQAVPVMSFRQLWEERYEYDKKRVRVTGWLGMCDHRACHLYPSAGTESQGISISIGKSAVFDRAVTRLHSRWLTIEGTINARCFVKGDVVDTENGGSLLMLRCPGRTGQLVDPRVVDFHPAPIRH